MQIQFAQPSIARSSIKGLIIAAVIIVAWLSNLLLLLSVKISGLHWLLVLGAILLQTFLNTGLFITAHDAIHGLVYPPNPSVNQGLGTLCVWAYALLSYQNLSKKHRLHHAAPASEIDPDFCSPRTVSFVKWYIYFMKQYWSWKQTIQLTSVLGLIVIVFKLSFANLALFWGLPLILSSLQLFYFGTYLPHQEPEGGYSLPHRAKSYPLPWLLSLLACYHFNYHHEHHAFPEVPWWQLPNLHHNNSHSAPCI